MRNGTASIPRMTMMATNTLAQLWAALDALRDLSPTHPLRQAALDAIWYFTHPDWTPVEFCNDCPF